jgi:hypothetical protein
LNVDINIKLERKCKDEYEKRRLTIYLCTGEEVATTDLENGEEIRYLYTGNMCRTCTEHVFRAEWNISSVQIYDFCFIQVAGRESIFSNNSLLDMASDDLMLVCSAVSISLINSLKPKKRERSEG